MVTRRGVSDARKQGQNPRGVRRVCSRCRGWGRTCQRCDGRGTLPPVGHFDAVDDWPGDGCDDEHVFVKMPCKVCRKSELDERHRLDHKYEPGGPSSSREGCVEHGVTYVLIEGWWLDAAERAALEERLHAPAKARQSEHGA